MNKIKNIFIGWGKKLGFLPTSEAEKKLAELRFKICCCCTNAIESQVLKFLDNGEAEYGKGLYCKLCKCECEAKSLVVSEKCPIKNW